MQQSLLLGWLVKALSLKNGTKALITLCAAKASVKEQTKINYLDEIRRQAEPQRNTQHRHHIIPLTGCHCSHEKTQPRRKIIIKNK